jgi:hypothetical protein
MEHLNKIKAAIVYCMGMYCRKMAYMCRRDVRHHHVLLMLLEYNNKTCNCASKHFHNQKLLVNLMHLVNTVVATC